MVRGHWADGVYFSSAYAPLPQMQLQLSSDTGRSARLSQDLLALVERANQSLTADIQYSMRSTIQTAVPRLHSVVPSSLLSLLLCPGSSTFRIGPPSVITTRDGRLHRTVNLGFIR